MPKPLVDTLTVRTYVACCLSEENCFVAGFVFVPTLLWYDMICRACIVQTCSARTEPVLVLDQNRDVR